MNATASRLDTLKANQTDQTGQTATTFSQLPVNAQFSLPAKRSKVFFGPRGPFVKVSKFKYRRVQTGTRQVSDAELKMRSGKARVIAGEAVIGGDANGNQ